MNAQHNWCLLFKIISACSSSLCFDKKSKKKSARLSGSTFFVSKHSSKKPLPSLNWLFNNSHEMLTQFSPLKSVLLFQIPLSNFRGILLQSRHYQIRTCSIYIKQLPISSVKKLKMTRFHFLRLKLMFWAYATSFQVQIAEVFQTRTSFMI